MAITSWPFSNQDTSETEFSRWAKNLRQSGVEGNPEGTALKPFGDSSGLVVKIPAGFAIVRGFALLSTAEESLAISGGGGSPRIDRIVARLDPTADEITLEVVAGTPGAVPVAPSLEQTETGVYEMPLAQVLVDAGASTISAGKVTDEREFMGGDVGGWTTANRPLSPRKGQLGLNFTTSVFEWWTGSEWGQLTPTSLSASVITSGVLSVDRLPTVPVNKGGTGATTAAGARTELGAAAATHTHSASDVNSGTFAEARIPDLNASKITAGTLAEGRVPDLNASKITAGTLAEARIPDLNASKITAGTITRPINNAVLNYMQALICSADIQALGSIGVAGNGTFNNAWNLDVSAVTRRAVWMNSNGTLGHTSSSRRYKKAIRRAETDPEAILSLEAKYYAPRSKAWKAEQDHEPTYIGLIAEDLHDAGLWEFIWYDDQGRPDGIHYELLGIATLIAAQHIAKRVTALEEAVAKLTQGGQEGEA